MATLGTVPPSTPRGTIRRTWCRDHAEDIGAQTSQFLQRRVSSHLLHRHSVGIRDSSNRYPPVAEINKEQHIIRRQARHVSTFTVKKSVPASTSRYDRM